MLISAKIHISDLHQWKLTADHYLENKALGRNWKYGNKRWKTHKVGNTASDLVIDKDSGDALGLIKDKLEIGVEVNLTLAHENDPIQKWELIKDKRTGWMKLKKPNGFFLESSENGKDLFIQGTFLLKVISVPCERPENLKGNFYGLQFFQKKMVRIWKKHFGLHNFQGFLALYHQYFLIKFL